MPKAELAAKMKKMTPMLHIDARVGDGMGPNEDMSYKRKEAKRLKAEIKEAESLIKDWDAEKVAAQALKSLKTDVVVKKARLAECEAYLEDAPKGKDKDDDYEDDEE